jgi:hypothetical protein
VACPSISIILYTEKFPGVDRAQNLIRKKPSGFDRAQELIRKKFPDVDRSYASGQTL